MVFPRPAARLHGGPPASCDPVPTGLPDTIPYQLQYLALVALVGRLRRVHGTTKPFNFPVAPSPAQLLSRNDSKHPWYVRVIARPGSGSLTFFTKDQGASIDAGDPVNLGTTPEVEFILLPGETLYGQNQGGAAYNAIVNEVEVAERLW